MLKNTNLNTSTKLILMMSSVIVLVLTISITMTYKSNERLIILQAMKMAQTVANQVITDRSHYVKRVVKKVNGSAHSPKEGYTDDSPNVPLPATFIMGVAEDVSASQNEYRYKLVSRWNINSGNSLSDDFLKRGFNHLMEQEKQAKSEGRLSPQQAYKGWKPYYEALDINGKPHLRFMAADLAAGQDCVTCHNNLENRDDVLAIRSGIGVEKGKVFELNDLMGAVAVDVNLEEAGAVASASTRNMMIWLSVVGAFVLGGTFAFVKRAMVKPIALMIDRLELIAQGDLTQRFEADRQDEFGRLGRRFNATIQQLHDAIAEVGCVTHEVASASTEIAASAEEMAQGMVQQTQQVLQISSAIDQMSSSVVEVARQSSEAANNAAESGRVAEEGGTVVNQTIEGMQSISAAVSAGAASVTELGKRGEQIGQIIEVINDIADQTNLLALNAAIEAARAGEHGRGFAVVADEVRKLADRTTKATGEVAQSIKAIQAETHEAVQRMNAGTDQVKTGVDRASEAGRNLQMIVASARDVADMIRSIAAAAEQQSAASEQVSRNVEAVSSVSRQANEGANQSAAAAAQLSAKAEQLQTLVGRFQIEFKGGLATPPGSDHLKAAARRFKANLQD